MSSDSNNDGLSESEIIKLLFKNYMNFTTTSHNKLFYEETQLSNNNNIFSSGVLTNSPPVDTPNFTDNVVQTASELSQYLSYAALPNINIDKDWFNSKRTIGLTDSSGVFSVDSTDDTERTVLRLETIKLDYLGGTSAAFVCNDNSGVNILQNLVPPNYATNGYSTRLWYLNNNNILAEIGWLASRITLGTGTYVGHDVSFGGALFDSKNGVITFYDVLNDDPAAVFSEVSCNFYLTATKYIGSTLADGGVGSGPVNPAGQTFHEVVTGAPQAFTMGDISSTLFTIDISWDFADIQPTKSNNRLFNFPLPNKRDRVIPYMSHICFDISSSTGDIIDFSANIEIDSSHNYAEDSKEVSGNIPSSTGGNDLSYNLTYRTLTLTKFSEDTRTYTVNVWGVNESNESNLYKLPFVDISFMPDSETTFTTTTGNTYYTTRTNNSVSGTITAVDSDADNDGTDVSFGIGVDPTYGTLSISQTNNSLTWTYDPNTDFSGNDTFTIRTYSEIGGIIIDSNNGYTGFTGDIRINISVNDPTVFTGDLNVNTNVGEDISGIVYLYDPNSSIIYDISNDIANGVLSYESTPSDANYNPTTNDVTIIWYYTPDTGFTGEDSFTIIATDVIGGISSQQIIINIPYIYEIEITDYGSLDTNMKSVHDSLTPVGIDVSVNVSTDRYDLSGNQDANGYQFDIYKVDETEVSVEYLPSNMTTYGLAGINLSSIMKNKVFQDYSADDGPNLSYVETEFYNSLSDSTYIDDIIVYIVATKKSTGEHFMARINKDLPGFDEMNPWYLTNKVNEDSTLNGLSSGLGSGALPSSELQTDISNNSISDYFDTAQINGHDPIIIHINSNAFENHYFYFATKLY